MLRAEMRANQDMEFEEKGQYFSALAKEICKLGSIKLIDAMDETDLENYIYKKYVSIINEDLERKRIERYNDGIDLMNTNDLKKVKKAIMIFSGLNDYMDSKEMIVQCNEKIKELKSKSGIFGFLKSKK